MDVRRALRYGPLLLVVVAAAAANITGGQVREAEVGVAEWNGDRRLNAPAEPASPLPCPDPALAAFSERAAGLTGALALVEPAERQAQATVAAREIRSMGEQVASLEGGAKLAVVLADLAVALERYADGRSSAAADVRDASARNAELRAALYQRQTICGGR